VTVGGVYTWGNLYGCGVDVSPFFDNSSSIYLPIYNKNAQFNEREKNLVRPVESRHSKMI